MPSPSEAPPGVTLRFLPRPSGTAWAEWLAARPAPMTIWESRRIITPRLLLVHTNGANGEGTAASAYNWAMAAPSNTKPGYQVDRDGSAVKFLPTDREQIANYKASPFSIAIETADLGWGVGKPGGAAGFSPAQGETLAQIIAYETALWNIPIEYPTTWDGTGVGCHTEPFTYPYWTAYSGKQCPGYTKKAEMLSWIMPRALEIRYPPVKPKPPVPPPVQEDDMPIAIFAPSDANARFLAVTNAAGVALSVRWTGPGSAKVDAMLAAHKAAGAKTLTITVADLRNTFIDGPLPQGDTLHVWSMNDFANPA